MKSNTADKYFFAVETNNTTFTATLPITAAVDDATGAATLTDVSVTTKAGDITITAINEGDFPIIKAMTMMSAILYSIFNNPLIVPNRFLTLNQLFYNFIIVFVLTRMNNPSSVAQIDSIA